MKKYTLIIIVFCLSAVSLNAKVDNWTLVADNYNDKYFGVPIANGTLGLMPGKKPFEIKGVLLNNFYDQKKQETVSRLANALNPFCLRLEVNGEVVGEDNISRWSQSLDMKRAVLNCSFRQSDKADISYSVRALRSLPYCGLITVSVRAHAPVELTIKSETVVPKDYASSRIDNYTIKQDIAKKDYFINGVRTKTRFRGIDIAASSCIFTSTGACPERVSLAGGNTFEFYLIGAVCTGQDFLDPGNEADRELIFAIGEGVDRNIARHEAAWNELWKGDIIIEGDNEAQRQIRSSLFHLYSSDREGCSASIPPFGLSCREYNGHIFWDSDLWMYPPMLMLNRGIAESMVTYRTDRLIPALKRAMAYGYKGAMFPWESDYAGEEACPTDAPTGAFEHHITACVGIGVWNYYRVTRDKDWLLQKGWPLLKAVADFWVSRVDANKDGSYSIRNVVCADEFAEGVDDNAFTNGAAIVALRAASSAALICGKEPDPRWIQVADKIRILKGKNGLTEEYEGYDGRIIKQADANLLAYPLQLITDSKNIATDLNYYESRIHPGGPAMSFAILSLQWSRLGEGEKAYKLYEKALEGHLHGPFYAFSETAGQGDICFMTGCGGILQAVINGFCGLEITDNGIVQLHSALPRKWKSVTVTGVGPERKTFTNRGK